MVGTILVVLSEGFDDMAYLSSQVILEEAGNDVISVSPSGGAVKGETSSVMTDTLDTALDQELTYNALILAGGKDFSSIEGISDLVKTFNEKGKIIAAFGSAVKVVEAANVCVSVSTGSSPVVSDNVHTLLEPKDSEAFVENLASNIN